MANFKNILLIDEDPVCLLILKRIFFLAGFAPIWIQLITGFDAIDFFNEYPLPDLVFIDPFFNDMKANEFLKALNDLHIFQQTKVCLLTTFYEHDLDTVANGYPFFAKFSKPFRAEYLGELTAPFVSRGHAII